jgi:hypothetical protein
MHNKEGWVPSGCNSQCPNLIFGVFYSPSVYRKANMNHRHVLIAGAVLTVINLIATAVNLSIPARADVAGMDKMAIYHDRDFRYAVEYVVESCKVDGERIKC